MENSEEKFHLILNFVEEIHVYRRMLESGRVTTTPPQGE